MSDRSIRAKTVRQAQARVLDEARKWATDDTRYDGGASERFEKLDALRDEIFRMLGTEEWAKRSGS